jgi:hypothetical protein
MISGSVFQTIRTSDIFFTTYLSRIVLKTKIKRHQLISILIILFGISLVGLSCINNKHTFSITGIILMLVAQLFGSIQYVVEELILNKYHIHPLQLVGWEGIWGTSIYSILIFTFYFIKCESNNVLCFTDNEGVTRLENMIFAFRQLINSFSISVFLMIYISSMAIYNYVGIMVTKQISSSSRVIMDNLRVIIVWIFFLLPIWPKDWVEEFSILQMSGFIFVIIGALLYYEIISFGKEDRIITPRNIELIEE